MEGSEDSRVIQLLNNLVTKEQYLVIQTRTSAPQGTNGDLLLEAAQIHTAMVIQDSINLVLKDLNACVSTLTCALKGVNEKLLEAARAHTAKVIWASIIQVTGEQNLVNSALSRALQNTKEDLLLEEAQPHAAKPIQASILLSTEDPKSDIPTQNSASADTKPDSELLDVARGVVEDIIKSSRDLILKEEVKSTITDRFEKGEANELALASLMTRTDITPRKIVNETKMELEVAKKEPFPISETTDRMCGRCCGTSKESHDGEQKSKTLKRIQGLFRRGKKLFTCSSRLPKEEV